MKELNPRDINEQIMLLNRFLSQRSDENELFQEVSQIINNIKNDNHKKLSVGIHIQDDNFKRYILNFFRISDTAINSCEFIAFSKYSKERKVENIKNYTLDFKQENNKKFNLKEINLLGRSKEKILKSANKNDGIIELPNFKKVSGVHAKISIQKFSEPNAWTIYDLKSKNGTYVNGERLSEGESLKLNDGDRITLGSSTSSEKYPEFIFEESQNSSIQKGLNSNPKLENFNLICLAIKANSGFNDIQTQLIKNISYIPDIEILIIADETEINDIERANIKKNLYNIFEFLKSNFPDLNFQIETIDFKPFVSNFKKNNLKPSVKRKYDDFFKNFNQYTKDKKLSLSSHNSQSIISRQIIKIEKYLSEEENKISENQERLISKLDNLSTEEIHWKKQRVRRDIIDEREEFTHNIRDQLRKALNEISSDNRPGSFPRQLKGFIDNLDISVTNEGEETRVKLQTKQGHNIHDEIIDFCKFELKRWAEKQWNSILYEYNDGGLNALSLNVSSKLKYIPDLQIESFFDDIYVVPNFSRSVDIVFLEMSDSVENFQDAGGGKNLLQLGLEGGTYMGMAFLNPSMAVLQGFRLASHLFSGSIGQKQLQQEKKLQSVCDNLRRQTFNYYQRLSKSIADELYQDINNHLRQYERKIKSAIDNAEEQITMYLSDIKQADASYLRRLKRTQHDQKVILDIKKQFSLNI